MFIFDVLDAATYRPTMTELTATTAELLATANAAQLPQPRFVTISSSGRVGLQFPPETGSITAIISWASAFCAAVRSDTHQGEDGPEVWPRTEFTYDNARIDLYAHVPVPTGGPAEPAPPHADYPHEPGRLYGCPACEARCHCTPGAAECVYDGPHQDQSAGDGDTSA